MAKSKRLYMLPPRITTQPPRILVAQGRGYVSPELRDPSHQGWRLAVMKAAGWRCQAIEADGVRCAAKPPTRLIADHVVERRDDASLCLVVANGCALCGRHHSLKSAAMRTQRMGLPLAEMPFKLAPQIDPNAPAFDPNAPGRFTIA